MKPPIWIALRALAAALLLAGCADESPEKRLASARAYLQKNDTKSAVIEIKNALQTNPELGEARYLLGSALLKEGNAVAAEVELRKALAAPQPQEMVVPELARSMLMLGQAKKVVDEFGSTRIGKPQADASLQTTLATAYAALGKPEQFKSALAAALQADANHAPALLLSARQKAGARDVEGALAVVESVLARNNADTEAWQLKGDILLHAQSKPDEALATYRRALQADPNFRPAHVASYLLLLQQGKLDEATQQLEQLKRFGANHPQTKYFEAQLAFQKKDFKLARDLIQPLVQQAPNNARVLQLAGAVELQLGALAQAEIYLLKATQLAPQLALAQRLLIETYLRSGQAAKALTTLNATAGKDGIAPALYSVAGQAYLQSGDAKKAEEYFAKALKLDPDNARKRTALALTHLAGGQGETAVDELQNIAASDAGTTADMALISAYLRRKDYAKALAAIDKLESKQADKPIAANLRGRIQLLQKDSAGARKSFERALAIDPNFFAAAASLAAMDVDEKKPEDAGKRFEALLAKNPKNGQALLALAQLAAASGAGKDQVSALLAKAIDANPAEAVPRLLLIEQFVRSQDTKQALASAQSAVAAVPNSPELLGALGRVQLLSGEPNQAIATYSKLIALQPLSPRPLIQLSEAQMANKDTQAARQSLRKALEIKPDHLHAQRRLVLVLMEEEKFQDAIGVARTVQQQRPKEAAGFSIEGDIKAWQKDWTGAAAAYRAALRQAQSSESTMKLLTALKADGHSAEAAQLAAAWIKSNPKDAGFLAFLGDAAIQRKDYAAAEKLYADVLRLQPANPVALNNMAWVAHQMRRDGAMAYAEKANRLAPNHPAFMDTLAGLLSAAGEHSRAIELQGKAVGLQPANGSLRLNLAKIYIAAGDKPRAKSELASLEKLGDKHPAYREAVSLLSAL